MGTRFFLDAYLENLDRSPELREARALCAYWSNCELAVRQDELVVGMIASREAVGFHIGSATYIDRELASRDGISERELELVQSRKYEIGTTDEFIRYHGRLFDDEETESIRVGTASSTFFGGHMVLDYEGMVRRGLSDFRRAIASARERVVPENPEFYDAMETTLGAFETIIARFASLCESLGMTEKARELRWLAGGGRPRTFSEAVQLVWLAHYLSSADTFGRFDKYLRPFYEDDISEGRLTRDGALDILKSLMVKIEEADSIQNMTIGGSGNFTELTKLVMRATREMGFKGPNLCLRTCPEMPQDFRNEIAMNLATGQGLPALYNEPMMIKYLEDYGIPHKDAADFSLAGCSQVMIPGKTQFVNDIGLINAAKVVELYVNSGDFTDYDSFMRGLKQSFARCARLEASINNKDLRFRSEHEGYTLRSLFTDDCIEKGLGCYRGGARYNGVQLEVIGLSNAADSVAALKRAVFDEKVADISTLRAALKADFEGFGELRNYLLNRCPKYGNGDPEVDSIRKELTDCVFSELRRQPGEFGGTYIPGEVIFVVHDWMGRMTGATPDGRLSGTVLADSAGAVQGMDRRGPTALLNSVLAVPSTGIVTTIALNLKFSKSMWDSSCGKVMELVRTFFERGGQQVQINVCDRSMLEDALAHPEKYTGLVVRVGGYSAYFNTLSDALKRDIIDRTELAV